MKRSTKTLRLVAVAAAGTLVLAACGGGNDTKSGDGGKVAKGDGVLTSAPCCPQTGDLAFLGPPEFAGVELAVKDINEAGGVLGKDVAIRARPTPATERRRSRPARSTSCSRPRLTPSLVLPARAFR